MPMDSAAITAEMQKLNDDVLRQMKGYPVTVGSLEHIRDMAVRRLKELQELGDIPSEIPIARTRVLHDGQGGVDLRLPMRLVLLAMGTKQARHYAHDCSECRFLGHHAGADLYFCSKQATSPTVIARRSSEPSNYESGIQAARISGADDPLAVALQLAIEDGLTEER